MSSNDHVKILAEEEKRNKEERKPRAFEDEIRLLKKKLMEAMAPENRGESHPTTEGL
jgi:hypothetical protein